MVRAKSEDIGSDDSGRLHETEPGEQEQDPVSSLHDTDEETGDEAGLKDTFSIDSREAKERGVVLDSAGGQEPELDWPTARQPDDGSNASAFERATWWQLRVDPWSATYPHLSCWLSLTTWPRSVPRATSQNQ